MKRAVKLRKETVMNTVNVKPLIQQLRERLLSFFVGHRAMPQVVERTLQPSVEPAAPVDSEDAFLADIAHLPEAERTERSHRRQMYAAIAARQGIAAVEWCQQRYQETGNPLYRP
jgi:hypothetical protein